MRISGSSHFANLLPGPWVHDHNGAHCGLCYWLPSTFLRRCGKYGGKFAVRPSEFGWNALCSIVGIDEHPKTVWTERKGGELFGAPENATFYEEMEHSIKVPNKWSPFAKESADGIKNPVTFPF
jgi:hypothetical protein